MSRCMSVAAPEQSFDAACVTSKCENNKVTVKINGVVGDCPVEGGKVKIGEVTVDCPKYTEFCNDFNDRCPYDCHGQGLCMSDKTCQCLDGFSGKDCNTCTNCTPVTDSFILDFENKTNNPGEEPFMPQNPQPNEEPYNPQNPNPNEGEQGEPEIPMPMSDPSSEIP